MTGDKPDPRIRTPMQWRRGDAAGFTTGTPWEPLQPDSLTANVAVQDADAGSLLNLYRRVIHLRAEHPALAAGKLVPLTADNDAALAYLRRDGDRAALIVANLGTTSLSGVAIASEAQALPPGRYEPGSLLGGRAAAPLVVTGAGRIAGYVPLRSLGPLETHVFDVSPAGR